MSSQTSRREGDAENLPFAPNSFDVVISQFGHMFAPRPDVAVAEMLKVLKPGGTIALVVPALSARHQCEAFERTAGPVVKLVEMLTATDPRRLESYRSECEALVAEYLQDNVLRQGYLMTRATKTR